MLCQPCNQQLFILGNLVTNHGEEMTARTILNVEKPTTQAIESVKALLSWRGRAVDPLPSFVEMGSNGSRCVLVLSNKKDCYYVTTSRACSCPAATFNHGPCKHQRSYFPNECGRKLAGSARGLATISQEAEPAASKIGKWPGGMNGPIDPDEIEAAKAASPLYVDTTPDASPGELAYHSIKADRDLWPLEA